MPLNFALIGAAGYVAPRHMRAIRDTGNRLVAAADPHDSVGVLDAFAPTAAYFRDAGELGRHLAALARRAPAERVEFVTVCSPNHLHEEHVRLAFGAGADVICEKPIVIEPRHLDALAALELGLGRRVYTVLQLRVHPALLALRERLAREATGRRRRVELTYITARGPWYDVSWKGSEAHSGGLAFNIGVHLFDLVLWLFGPVQRNELAFRELHRMGGYLELATADVVWFLSVHAGDLPFVSLPQSRTTLRTLSVDGLEVEFADGFTELHTKVYQETLAGRGLGVADSRPAIELVHAIRTAPLTARPTALHPLLASAAARTV